MANLWVIMTGLCVLVEKEKEPKAPCAVLMKRVPAQYPKVGSKKMAVLPHEPVLTLKPKGARVMIEGKAVEFLPHVEGPPTIQGRDLLLPLGKDLASPSRLRDKILEGGVLSEGAMVILAGGDLEPIHVDKNFDLEGISRKTNVFLIGLYDPDSKEGKEVLFEEKRAMANGLLFRRRIQGIPSVRVGDEEFELSMVEKKDMGKLMEDDKEQDYVVWVVNVANTDYSDPHPRFDLDFYLLYDWLEEEFVRYVPVTERNPADDSKDGTPPGQCMNGYALA